MELLVASSVGLIITAITLGLTQSSKFVLGKDIARTRLTQNLRGSFDIITSDIRIAGENLADTFPSIILVNGNGTIFDSLTLRRGLLAEVLTLCSPLAAGPSAANYLVVGNNSTTPGCGYASNQFAASQFKGVRDITTGTLRGFILNTGTRNGQFFDYQGNTDTGTEIRLNINPVVWSAAYPVSTSAIYLIDEQRYILEADRVKRYLNGDLANPQTISFGITQLDFSVMNLSGTLLSTFGASDDWTKIRYIEMTLGGKDRFAAKDINRSLKGRLFPRNILSH
jgi:hypothetical protein